MPKLFKLFLILLIINTALISGFFISVRAATSPDAIAVRVMPNEDHFSPTRWYKENIKVKGSPQALNVDGYQAVRDGRTVYVNAANVSGSDFYTNIYIISYNQSAEAGTTDIFGQILDHWKFNANLTEVGTCRLTLSRNCLIDKDCPSSERCNSPKAQVIRDTKRLADLKDIELALENYQSTHSGKYPSLSAGSYLAGKSLSVWPSWQGTLAQELAVALPIDPFNRMGACEGFDSATCWNQNEKKFAGTVTATGLTLPANSYAYVYSYNSDGSYSLCAPMESTATTGLSSTCQSSAGQSAAPTIDCSTTISIPANTAPYSVNVKMTGQNINGFTSWIIEPANPSNWTSWQASGWQWTSGFTGLELKNTAVSSIKEIAAAKAAASGDFSYRLKATDGQTIANATCSIKVNCTPTCPTADTICEGTIDTRDNGCGGNCNVSGTKTGGACCTATCNSANQPNCQTAAPANSITGSGNCCNGQACYQCKTNYTWHSGTSACVADTRPFTCTAKPATGTAWNTVSSYTQTWTGLAWSPADSTTAYNATADEQSCRFKCDTNYTWHSGTSACVADTQIVDCTDKPINSDWNTTGTVVQTWTGTGWAPSNVSAYDTEDGICKYKCSSGYVWNNSTQTCNLSCTPSCLGKNCGSDGCGGSCGTCDTNCIRHGNFFSNVTYPYGCCVDTQPMNIKANADNSLEAYYDGIFYGYTSDWNEVLNQNFNYFLPGKNVIAFKAWDYGGIWGLSSEITFSGGCGKITTNYLPEWKCTKTYSEGWSEIDFDDSAWANPVLGNPGTPGIREGNYLEGVQQIWALQTGGVETIFCRATFWQDLPNPNIRIYECTPPSAANGYQWTTVSGYFQTFNESIWLPADDPTTEYNPTPDTASCRYKCTDGFIFDYDINECVQSSACATCADCIINLTPGAGVNLCNDSCEGCGFCSPSDCIACLLPLDYPSSITACAGVCQECP